MLEHGFETGTIKRLPHGEFIEVHGELTERERLIRDPDFSLTPEEVPEVERPTRRAVGTGRRSRLADFFFTRDEPVVVHREEADSTEIHESLRD
jgi:ubiquinol-cytochrome c reductase cytochrome b subunit